MDVAIWARVPCEAEVFGLFSDLIPREAMGEGGALEDIRGRQGKVPDFLFRLPMHSSGQLVQGALTDTLAELKVINAGVSRYPRGGAQGRDKAVDRRARALPHEYEAKLSKLDQQLHGTANGVRGPLVSHLNSFPCLQGLVVGIFGEASTDLHRLIGFLAACRGKYVSESTGMATSEGEKAQILGQIRRKLSTAFIRANALCTIHRVGKVCPGSREAAKRRGWAAREEEIMRQERRAYWGAFLGGGGTGKETFSFPAEPSRSI